MTPWLPKVLQVICTLNQLVFTFFYLIPLTRILVNNKTKQAEEEEMSKKKERFQPIEMVEDKKKS